MLRVALFCLLVFVPISVHAGEACGDMANQGDMNECFVKAYKKTDAKLNRVYQALLKKLDDAPTQKLLRDAQRAWLTYRNTQCTFETSDSNGGGIHPTASAHCLDEKTAARVKELESQLTCEEGDMSCVFRP